MPSKQLNNHVFKKVIEGMFIEINLRKTKLLLFGTYHSTHPDYGTNNQEYFKEVGEALDVYCNYEKFLLAGDFNTEETNDVMSDFLSNYGATNLVKDKTCFKSLENPSSIDLFLTNCHQSFQGTTTVSTGLSDFHKLVVTCMKTTFPKAKPKIIQYRNFKDFNEDNFRVDLRGRFENQVIDNYNQFDEIFLEVLNRHAPPKKKVVRANHKPYMTKIVRKAIMRRSALENKFYKDKSLESGIRYRKQKNYTKRLIKREKKKYFSNLNMNNYTDNKRFWQTVKPLFSNGIGAQKITLVEGGDIISDDQTIAETFNNFFINSVKSLNMTENMILMTPTGNLINPIEVALKKFENHPSIIDIKNNVVIGTTFSFSKVSKGDIEFEIRSLKTNKASTFMNIPTKQLKQVVDVVVEPLMNIWNDEIIHNLKFSTKLKYADITPIYKKLENIFAKNYRPVSILPAISKLFERIMQKQIKEYIEKYLSQYLCG